MLHSKYAHPLDFADYHTAEKATCTYTMRDGDSLTSVALALGTSEAAIQIINPGLLLPSVGSAIDLPVGATCRGELPTFGQSMPKSNTDNPVL